MTTAPDEIVAAGDRLRHAGSELRRRPLGETLDSLAGLFDGWSDSGSPWRQKLVAMHPAACGFDDGMVAEGLERGLGHWTGSALIELVERELASRALLERSEPPLVAGFPLTTVVLAGSIPMPTLLALVLPLVLRSPVLAKCAARDPITAPAVADSLAELDPLLGRCIEIVTSTRGDDACTQALLSAECVVATGTDSSVHALASKMHATQRFVGYGHRLSLAVLGSEACRPDVVEEVAARLALDVALWDQLGCLSPIAVWVEGDLAGAERVSDALAAALVDAERRWPRGEIAMEAAAAIARERSEAELRAAAGRPVRVRHGDGTSWTIVLESDGQPRAYPLHRFLRVHPVADRGALLSALAPLSPHLAAVAVEGVSRERELAKELAALGASRICRPGELQSPPLGWHHDGRPLLVPLARFCDLA